MNSLCWLRMPRDIIYENLTNYCDKRAEHGNAYQKWTKEDDELLIKRYEEGYTMSQLSESFKRGQGAIKSRLRKLGKEVQDGQDI